MKKYINYHEVSGISNKILEGSFLKRRFFTILKKRRKAKLFYRLYGLPSVEETATKVLDIGCGSGYTLAMLKELNPLVETYGVDIIKANDLPSFIKFYKVDLEKESLPFNDESFDFVMCRGVIEHVLNPLNIFNESFRVLKKGGKLHVLTENWTSILVPSTSNKFTAHTTNFYDDYTHIRPYTKKSLERMFKTSNFSNIKIWTERNILIISLMPILFLLQITHKFDLGRLIFEIFGVELFGEAYKP